MLCDMFNSTISDDLALGTQLQHISERLQDCSELYLTGKGLCLQPVFRVQCTVSTTSLILCLSPFSRLAVLVQCRPISESLWHSIEWQRDYSCSVWFTPEYGVVLGNILSSGPFADTVQKPRLLLREAITLGIFPVVPIQMVLRRAAQRIYNLFSISSVNLRPPRNKRSGEHLHTLFSKWSVKEKIKITVQCLP